MRATAILITGPAGSGKSWLACALAQYACRRGHSALYLRAPRLAEELRILHGNGGFSRWLATVARTDVLVLDDVPVHRVRAENPSSAVAYGTDYTSALSRPVQARI